MRQKYKASDRKNIRATSFVASAAVVLNAVWGLMNVAVGNQILAIENLSISAAFVAVFFANRRGFHFIASILVAVLFLGHQAFAIYAVGFDSGAHLFLLLGATGAFLIFRRADLPVAILFAGISAVAFLGCVIWQDQLPARYIVGSLESMERINAVFVLVTLMAVSAVFVINASKGEIALEAANRRINELLNNVLPQAIAERLTAEPDNRIADYFESVSVAFLDVVGFTAMASAQRPGKTIEMLDNLFSAFDEACIKHGVLKIKTIGDGYMFAAGVPQTQANHQIKVVEAGFDFIAIAKSQGVEIRVGAHCGEVVAGVIGRSRFQYDLLGDTVNVASRMETVSDSGAIRVSDAMVPYLKDHFRCSPRGTMPIKGKGDMRTWTVAPFDKQDS